MQRFLACASVIAMAAMLAACGGGTERQDSNSPSDADGPHARALAAADLAEAALTPVAATASASERPDLGPAAAIDHDDNTRWSSGFNDDQWLMLDYGKSVAIHRVRLNWERAHASRYVLEASEDGTRWTAIKTVDNSQGGLEEWTGLTGQGRFLRMRGVKRSTQYGYSIHEIQAFAGKPGAPPPQPDPAPTPPPPPPPGPTPPSPTPPSPTPPGGPGGGGGGQPGVVIRPVAATSSAVENPAMSAAMAIDGSRATRWASTADDSAWIQFDFGRPTPLGALKLLWEGAHGKEYALQVSDDGRNWTQVRYVTQGKGGTEEFLNLGVTTRYVRLQGVARATQYGYSLFDAEFKTPGSDNSLPVMATTALPFPANGAGLAPTPTTRPPLETLQFALPDGTLVTRFGMVGRSRHARERGEEWNEVGYGRNETVDAAGRPQDRGPGAHLNFVANYFKNRTWGVEIIDNSRVPGVTRPQLVVNHYYQQAQRGGGHVFVRRFDTAEVTGFGWMSPGRLLDDSTYTVGLNDVAACPVVPLPPQNALRRPSGGFAGVTGANDGCTLVFDTYPGHRALMADANGVLAPTGRTVPARPLVLGDVLEFSSNFFSTRAVMDALGDTGGIRYYTNELTYVMGTGLRPWYGVQPRLMNAPLPDETLQGGIGSISYDYADNASFLFQQPHNHIGMQNMQRFVEGRRWIHSNLSTGDHTEPGNDRNTAAVSLQGPRFNQSTCVGCHVGNGRSLAPLALNQRLDTMAVRTAAVDANGQQVPHPTYGMAVQMNSRSPVTGAAQDWGTSVRVAGFETRTVTLADGTAVELRRPRLAFDGPTPAIYSLRNAQPMIGTGLLEAVPDADILSRVRATPDADGVKGTANYVFDPETGAVRLGRFGWKASKVSLRHQAAAAALTDMSVTSPVYPNRDCLAGPRLCNAAHRVDRGLSEDALRLITRYVALLGVPAQRSLESGFPRGVTPLPHLAVNPVQVAAGARVFQASKCAACHTSQLRTGSFPELAEVRDQVIRPYTNLLLHDMGPDMGDGLVEGQATGRLWRTAPLWGIGLTEAVAGGSGRVGYLHDGRARNLTEAIMWHGGEAETSRKRFEQLSKADRDALVAFLKSL